MNIVCIAASFVPSNTANSIQVLKATHALRELGHTVTLVVPGDNETDWEDLQALYGLRTEFDIRWVSENLSFRRYDFALKSVRLARKLNPDVIYTWVLQGGLLAVWRGIPTILELHDQVTGRVGPWLFRRFLASKTHKRVLTNSEALRQSILSDFNLRSDEFDIVVAPNAVELERYQGLPSPAEARKELGLEESFTVGYTGHFYAGRGIELMFDLANEIPEINFLWVGGQPADVTLWQNKLHSENMDNVRLTGFVDNAILPQYQAACEVLLMPYGNQIAGSGGGDSAEIASPMKMFEYMAAGRAIISSDLPVIHEVLDEKSAVFCPPEDLSSWKAALLALREDPARREKLGTAARGRVKAHTWRSRAEQAINDFIDS